MREEMQSIHPYLSLIPMTQSSRERKGEFNANQILALATTMTICTYLESNDAILCCFPRA